MTRPPLPARHIGIGIAAPFEMVDAYLRDTANWPHWAAGLGSLRRGDDGIWAARQADGADMQLAFAPPNDHGIHDHSVIAPDGRIIAVPLRLLRNGDGTEAVLTLFRQRDMDDGAFQRDADAMRRDLDSLRRILETQAGRRVP